MNEAAAALLIFLLGIAFAAGVYASSARATRKQINGLGGRLNRVVAAVIHMCPDDKREEVTSLMLGLSSGSSEKRIE